MQTLNVPLTLLSLDKKSKRSTTSSQVRNYLEFSFTKNVGEYSSIMIAEKWRVFAVTLSLHCKCTECKFDCLVDVAKCFSYLLKEI